MRPRPSTIVWQRGKRSATSSTTARTSRSWGSSPRSGGAGAAPSTKKLTSHGLGRQRQPAPARRLPPRRRHDVGAPERGHGVVVGPRHAKESRALVDEEARGGRVAADCPHAAAATHISTSPLREVVRPPPIGPPRAASNPRRRVVPRGATACDRRPSSAPRSAAAARSRTRTGPWRLDRDQGTVSNITLPAAPKGSPAWERYEPILPPADTAKFVDERRVTMVNFEENEPASLLKVTGAAGRPKIRQNRSIERLASPATTRTFWQRVMPSVPLAATTWPHARVIGASSAEPPRRPDARRRAAPSRHRSARRAFPTPFSGRSSSTGDWATGGGRVLSPPELVRNNTITHTHRPSGSAPAPAPPSRRRRRRRRAPHKQ